MKLTRLELSGFKSFADTVELPFGDGITAIVGPNGCGKSNISDAVRWVLGEQRARVLRGARMDEVIFQGSTRRRPINVAEIAMCFDNEDGTLPLPHSEVVLTRRLSRSGQSDYLLNNNPVRLRDLQDLLRGTGLGSDAGVVIEAGMIERLLSDRAEERRSLFEEAAGIGLYRDRKAATERRLEKTAEDLQRLNDLISEIQTQVRSLARQRGKAERYQKFSEERFGIVMTLTRRRLAEFEEKSGALRARKEELGRLVPELRGRLAEEERKREACVQARATAEARRTELERRLADTRIDLERLEGDIKVSGERVENATTRAARAREERRGADERATQSERERDAAAAERAAAEAARASVQTELDLRSASEGEVRDRLDRQRALVREQETALHQWAERLQTMAGERTALERELEDLRTEMSAAEQRRAQAQREQDEARRQLDAARSTQAARDQEQREAAQEVERARHQFMSAREREAALRIEHRGVEESLAQLSARREALSELERNREGLAPAARALLGARDQFGDGAVLGPLSDFLRTSAAGAPLAERRLADWLHAVLVRDPDAVEAVRAWHRAELGPLLLLPVTPGPARPGDAEMPQGMTVDGAARAWVAALLGDTSPLDDLGTALRRANGAVLLTGSDGAGPLSRRAELDGLARELGEAEHRLELLGRETDEAAAAHAAAERAVETAKERADRTRAALREAQGAADDASRRVHRAERERAEAEEAHGRVTRRVSELEARAQAVAAEQRAGGEERARVEAELASQRETLTDLEAAQESARERRVHWQVEEAQVSAREAAAQEREARAEAAFQAARQQMTALDAELERLDGTVRELEVQRSEWTDTLAERRVAVQEMTQAARTAEEAVARAGDELTAAERRRDDTREALERLGEETHRLDLELSEATGERRSLIERIEVEFHKPVQTLLGEAPDVPGETDALAEESRRLAEAIQATGPVNLLAMEQYAEEAERLDFLTKQRQDLVEARGSLLQALREIDQTAKQMFLETFDAVRQHLQQVFETLFEGGECDVQLADPEDPLTCDIEIRAAPRGKRTQRIHLLSSGERALVAISLLFSIYLAKPAPFCLLDEVDAPLDDANVMRFVRLLDEFKADTQFIVITHNPRTMQIADAVYGVTMQEPGVSTIVGVRLGEVEQVVG